MALGAGGVVVEVPQCFFVGELHYDGAEDEEAFQDVEVEVAVEALRFLCPVRGAEGWGTGVFGFVDVVPFGIVV